MATFNNKLDASSYQHPGRDGPFQPLREKAMQSMVAAGIDYEYLAESPVAWAEDQDPFGHVTSQVYTHYAARAFNRMLDSWSIILGDKFAALEGASGVGVITNQYSVKIKRVVKYPDTVIAGTRISEVRDDRFLLSYPMWSVVHNAMVCEIQAWVSFFDYSCGKRFNLKEGGGVYSDLHRHLCERAAGSVRAIKEAAANPDTKSKL